MDACITAVEEAFRAAATGATLPSGVLGSPVPGGGFHVKVAGLTRERRYYVAKVNANFPDNPVSRRLPTIQGVICLFDAVDGRLLALLDSMEITSMRTAAATAVAAKYLARRTPGVVTVIGCGTQGRSQLHAFSRVRPIRKVFVHDIDSVCAERYAAEMSQRLGCDVESVPEYLPAVRQSDVVIACTTSRQPLLAWRDLTAGAFVAAVGADSESKQELDVSVLVNATVVADDLEQCARIGDLHHALDSGLMRREQVHAELADIVSNRRPGRTSDDEVTVFDSTGTALEDVAAASLVYERAIVQGRGLAIHLHE